jgi:hypothetical protein
MLNFYWKVSSEPGDELRFYIDGGKEYFIISGDVDWTPVSHYLGEKRWYTIEWMYVKDSVGSRGQDKGWVDDVVVVSPTPTPTLTPTSTPSPTLTSTPTSGVPTLGSVGT